MFEKELAALLAWFDAHNELGRYADNANHPIWGVVNENKFPHSFQYYGIILSYLCLFRKFNDARYLDKAIEAGDFLRSVQKPVGQFKFDTFEFNTKYNRGLTLIHNSLPAIALLELYKATGNEKYLHAGRENVLWQFARLWNGTHLTGCINQDASAAEALAVLYSIEKKPKQIKLAKRLADFCLSFQITTGDLAGGFIRGTKEDDLVIPWYDAKTALSFLNLYALTNEERYLESAKLAANFLKKVLYERGLSHWFVKKGGWQEVKIPYLVAPLGIVLLLFDRLGITYDCRTIIDAQKGDGSFPCARGYGDIRDSGNLGWNQFMLMYLAEVANKRLPDAIIVRTKEKIVKQKFAASQTISGAAIGPEKSGHVDVIRDHFVIYTAKITDNQFIVPYENNCVLRVRLENSLWKQIKCEKADNIVVRVTAYSFLLPYVLVQNCIAIVLKKLFNSVLFDFIAKVRSLRK